MSLVNLQAKVGYALIGIAGEKLLKQLGYPHMSVIVLLHRILDMAGIKVCTRLPNEHIYMFIFFFCKFSYPCRIKDHTFVS